MLGRVQTLSEGTDGWIVGPEHPAGMGPAGVPEASVLWGGVLASEQVNWQLRDRSFKKKLRNIVQDTGIKKSLHDFKSSHHLGREKGP